MYKNQLARRLGVLSSCVLLSAAANAEMYQFSYTFSGTQSDRQTYAPGARLVGFIEGTPDAGNPDRVIITSFGSVSMVYPAATGIPQFTFPSIENDEFNTYPADGRTPVVTFSGSEIAFRACPSGFTLDFDNSDGINDDCPFTLEGGFLIDTAAFGIGFATAADGTGAASPCFDGINGNTQACRLTDIPLIGSWQLTLIAAEVDPSVDLDPTATIEEGVILDKDVSVEQNVVVGQDTALDRGVSVGEDSSIGADSSLDRGVTAGSNVRIGQNVSIDAEVVIQDDVVIGDNVVIGRGTLVCAGVTIGESALIGKNALIDADVPATSEIPGSKVAPGSCP